MPDSYLLFLFFYYSNSNTAYMEFWFIKHC